MSHDHRVQCAAITRGCTSALIWEDSSTDLDERFLRINGWRLDHGKWICGDHAERHRDAEELTTP